MPRKLRNYVGISALAVAVPSTATAVDIRPYLEYEVPRKGLPTLWYTDVTEAGTALAEQACQERGWTGCTLTRTWYFNSLYFAEYRYTNAQGRELTESKYAYHYFTCDAPPSLYVIKGNQEWGPYPNRNLAPPYPAWGDKIVCRVSWDAEQAAERQSELGSGDCLTRPSVGNPINAGLNNKYQEVLDIGASGGSALGFTRYYNSGAVLDDASNPDLDRKTIPATARLGAHWRGTYDRSVFVADDGTSVRLLRHTGERIPFVLKDGRYQSSVDARGRLERMADGWMYYGKNGLVEHYSAQGLLTDINPGVRDHIRLQYAADSLQAFDTQGRSLRFTYDAVGRIVSVHDDAGVAVSYTYSSPGDLRSDLVEATYADGKSQRYTYNETSYVGADLPHALTGIFDESLLRFATFRYDKVGRAVGSEHSNGIDRFFLARQASGDVKVTDALNTERIYRYADVKGVRRLVGVDQPGGAGCGAAFSKLEYDDQGAPSRTTDFDGRITQYTHDEDGRQTSRTEGAGTPLARTIRTEWHSTFMLPARITYPGREERLTYDDSGNLTRRELWAAIDPAQKDAPLTLSRTWKFTYDPEGRLLQEEGPRSDAAGMAVLRRYNYRTAPAANCGASGPCDYRKGDLASIENALGHKDEVLRYDPAGRVLARRLANGTLIEDEYTKRGWLAATREARADGTIATTSLTYDERGNITSVSDPDGVTLRFEYDAANRLVKLFNPSNHKLFIELDKAGNPTTETAYDSFFQQAQLKRTFDALGRMATEQRADAGLESFAYDEVGRPTGATDGDGLRSSARYDALGRLQETIGDLDGRKATIKATHDPLDQVSSLADPDGLTTRYLTTGLGDLAHVDSPDGGEGYDEYDAAGLISRHEGPAGVGSFRVSRDALGRPLTLRYSDATLDTTFIYDTPDAACPGDKRHGLGMLSSMRTSRASTVFCYDAAGNISRKIQQWGTVRKGIAYSYTAAGRLATMSVEGGATVIYRYDIDGKVNGVSVDQSGNRQDLITQVAYRPFDTIESWTYANGWYLSNSHDKGGRLTGWGAINPKGSSYWLDPSPGGRLRKDASRPYAYAFDYDGLNYLNEVLDDKTGKSLRAFDYNLSGDRLAVRANGLTDAYAYQPGSHRLTRADGKAREYDAAGNLTKIGSAVLTYDATGRLASASEQGKLLVSYGYDGKGNRIARKVASTTKTTLTLFDETGQWIADYDEAGNVTQQAIWMGDMPVGLVNGGKLFYVGPGHLGSPREVLDPVRNEVVWNWYHNADPFGSTPPNEDPDGDGKTFVLDMRFPGQRFDNLTGLHANGARDYDPVTGRYIQVDPIGLAGGPNPYLYAKAQPLLYIDPSGRNPAVFALVMAAVGATTAAAGDAAIQLVGMYRSKWCKRFSWRELGIATAGGALSGAALPMFASTSPVVAAAGAAGVGATSNYAVHVANGGESLDRTAAWAVGTGALGGAIAGPAVRFFPYGTAGTAASAQMVARSNAAADIRLNVTVGNTIRGVGGATASGAPGPSGTSNPDCGCEN
ncbi:DUF6531 domain-containing protein [Luteibacter aegosomaticola]|uniref:RHS repeat-associated core domain-containing protein n=1 Tax=Luteibacter aegosomaticola TaxID=2911538 RepID=UPI001FF904E4|nr:RHS repeat-associated core domain-containing protein [Luteibacter aegosomaticola]UPG90952.1 DUF6531 domain-containing protein [Luteibacter aegosomaticola]